MIRSFDYEDFKRRLCDHLSSRVPYLESAVEPVNGTPTLLGVPFDDTACFRKGAAGGPDSIREASDCLSLPFFTVI